jgi:hypothetical protein
MAKGTDLRERFAHARRQAFWNGLQAWVTGRPNRLLSWDEARDKLGLRGRLDLGLQTVPVDRVVGSVGRYEDFDRAFMPLKDNVQERWLSIAGALYDGAGLPPVQLVKAGDVYFVVDGNHRVSVARERGIASLEARVVEVETRVPLTNHLDADELEVKGEYVRFLECTRLDELRPDQRIEFTAGGGYERLREHIAVHRYRLGQDRGQEVPPDEAVCDWYDHAYLPLVRLIRESGILAEFAHRTEADLYLWVVDHQHYLREQCGPGVSAERAAWHLAARHPERLAKRLVGAVREWLSGGACEQVIDQEAE